MTTESENRTYEMAKINRSGNSSEKIPDGLPTNLAAELARLCDLVPVSIADERDNESDEREVFYEAHACFWHQSGGGSDDACLAEIEKGEAEMKAATDCDEEYAVSVNITIK